jgi:hypothetical protein
MMATWKRTYGPEETYECGDVPYEIGSTYESDDGMRGTITYFVEEGFAREDGTPDSYGVRYKDEVYKIGNEDDSSVEYEWGSPLAYRTLEDAIAKAKSLAAVDESDMFL